MKEKTDKDDTNKFIYIKNIKKKIIIKKKQYWKKQNLEVRKGSHCFEKKVY